MPKSIDIFPLPAVLRIHNDSMPADTHESQSTDTTILSWIIRGAAIALAATVIFLIWGPLPLQSARITMGTIRTDGNTIVAAIERYKEAQGALPARLSDLVPTYLPRLEKVKYLQIKASSFPWNAFNRSVTSPWAYKLSPDKSSFALAVEAKPLCWYSSQSEEWNFMQKGFAGFDIPPSPGYK